MLVCRVLGDILNGISHSSTGWLYGACFVLSDKPSGTQALSECQTVESRMSESRAKECLEVSKNLFRSTPLKITLDIP